MNPHLALTEVWSGVSVRPILFEIFGWGVPSWHFFFVVAAFTAFFVALLCGRWAGMRGYSHAEPFVSSLNGIFVVCYLSGWFGARSLSIWVEQFDVHTVTDFFQALFSIGPMTFYGGACAAVVCGGLYAWLRRVDLKFALDCGIVGGVFALGVGRIGCFLNGDDYGAAIADQANPPWWAVKFDVLRDGGIYRYPVQLEETVASFVIGAIGLWLFSRHYSAVLNGQTVSRAGHTAAWVSMLSAAHRILNEGFRGDPRGTFFSTQISTSTGISLLIIAFCAYCLLRRRLTATHS